MMAYNGWVATWVQNRTQVATWFFFVFHVQTPFKTESCLIWRKKNLNCNLGLKLDPSRNSNFNVVIIIKQLLACWNLSFNFLAIIKQLSMPYNLSFNSITIVEQLLMHYNSSFNFLAIIEQLSTSKFAQQWHIECRFALQV